MKLKDDFPLTEQLIYFDNSVMGLMPESTLKVIEGYTESLVQVGQTESKAVALSISAVRKRHLSRMESL